jgi:bifunctional DNA-binding transcriptional regulator/antitoxin component of YhaV-PrlF toxin-antitoxin module
MRKTTIVSVTSDLQLEVPPEIQSKLRPGDEFIIWEEGENIFFQKLQKQKSISDLRSRVQSLGPDPNQPTLAELGEIVREYRQEH